jgi:hypothetical protein
MGIQGNPFFEYLARLRGSNSEIAPRRKHNHQYYMSHPDFKDAVKARFDEEYGDEHKATQLSLRCSVARNLLDAEPQEVKDQMKKECNEEHTREVEAFKQSGDGMPDPDVAAQRE